MTQGVGNVKHVVAVASGKGGVGKSSLAAGLAGALLQNIAKQRAQRVHNTYITLA